MRLYLLTAAQERSGDPPLPVMVIIAMLLLMLPYLIRVKTGRSITEWLSFSAARDWIWSKLPFGKDEKKKGTAAETAKSRNAVAVSKNFGQKGKNGSSQTQAQRVLDKKPEKAASNGMMQFVSDALNYTRRKKLFLILPGNVQYQEQTAELTMLVVTRARVIGVLCYAGTGRVHCRKDGGAWQETRGNKTTSLGPLCTIAREQTTILRSALDSKDLKQVPYETMLVFTSPSAVLAGDVPEYACKAEAFFKRLETDRDQSSGPLVPKEVGKVCSQLRSKEKKKQK